MSVSLLKKEQDSDTQLRSSLTSSEKIVFEFSPNPVPHRGVPLKVSRNYKHSDKTWSKKVDEVLKDGMRILNHNLRVADL